MKIPLDEFESATLEFKRADVLDDPVKVAREVAAMLNADGGKIWIGIEEEGGIARRAVQIADVALRRERLHDSLFDRLEPLPLDEVAVKVEQGLLVVDVKKGKRRPYSFLERSMRGFVVRADSRTLPMPYEELRAAFSRSRAPDEISEELVKLRANAPAGLSVWLMPEPTLHVDLRSAELENLLRTPEASGNRALGWNFTGELHRWQSNKAGAATWAASPTSHHLKITKAGVITFWAPLARLHWMGAPQEIYPWALAEQVVSVCRLFPVLAKDSPPKSVRAALSLRGAAGWTLRPFSPRSPGHSFIKPGSADADIELNEVRFDWEELEVAPDRCAWRLLELVYDHFGFGPNQMPPEYDPRAGRLVIPS